MIDPNSLTVEWTVPIENPALSCLPTGIVTDCDDNIYVTGFFGSGNGFLEKMDPRSGQTIWKVEDLDGQVTEILLNPTGNEVFLVVNYGQLIRIDGETGEQRETVEQNIKKLVLSKTGFVAFVWENAGHKIIAMDRNLQQVGTYDIPWSDWSKIAWCDNFILDGSETAVFLTCTINDTHDIIIFRIEL